MFFVILIIMFLIYYLIVSNFEFLTQRKKQEVLNWLHDEILFVDTLPISGNLKLSTLIRSFECEYPKLVRTMKYETLIEMIHNETECMLDVKGNYKSIKEILNS